MHSQRIPTIRLQGDEQKAVHTSYATLTNLSILSKIAEFNKAVLTWFPIQLQKCVLGSRGERKCSQVLLYHRR